MASLGDFGIAPRDHEPSDRRRAPSRPVGIDNPKPASAVLGAPVQGKAQVAICRPAARLWVVGPGASTRSAISLNEPWSKKVVKARNPFPRINLDGRVLASNHRGTDGGPNATWRIGHIGGNETNEKHDTVDRPIPAPFLERLVGALREDGCDLLTQDTGSARSASTGEYLLAYPDNVERQFKEVVDYDCDCWQCDIKWNSHPIIIGP